MQELQLTYEVVLDSLESDITCVTIYRRSEDGQLTLVNSKMFGPFHTQAEISRWVWKILTLDQKVSAG